MNIIDIARRTNCYEEFKKALAEGEGRLRRALQRFCGTLTIEEIQEGIDVCFRNATSLCDDARLLFEHKRWSRSFALSIAVLEETGKVVVLHSMVEIPNSRPKVWKQHWHEARRHSMKTSYGRTPTWHDELYSQIGAQFASDDLDERLLERLRQGALYVDFDQDDRGWRTPDEITEDMAEKQLSRAMKSLSQCKYYRQRGLFDTVWLKRRAEICSPVYHNYDEVPATGADRAEFAVKLLELRKRFFLELVNEGVLERMLPDGMR
jgi:AbiV family abortive infection protein